MRNLRAFVFDSGRWGVVSEVAALLVFLVGLWEHGNGKPLPSFIFVCVSVPLFWIGAYIAWDKKHRQIAEAQTKISDLEGQLSDVPRIDVLQHGFYVDRRTLQQEVGPVRRPVAELSCLHVKFRNDPKLATQNSIARNIRAELEFFDSSGRSICKFQGRWGDTTQPPYLPPGQSPAQVLSSADFEIGQDRELDIAFKYPNEPDSFGMSNETYAYPDWRHPKQRITVQDVRARVRLRGVGVDSSWDFWFENPQNGDLKRIKYLQAKKPPD